MSYSDLLSSSADKVIVSFIDKIAQTYSLSKDDLLSIWNGGVAKIISGGGEIPKELISLTRLELVELCKNKNLKHSGTKGELIQRIISSEKEIKTQPLITPKLVTKVAPSIALHRNKFGNFEDPDTNFVFHEKTEKVYGKQNADGSIASLTVDDINICNKFKFGFDIPSNLQQQDDKVELLAELDEEDEIEVEVEEEEDEEEEEEEEVEVELEIDDDE